MDVLGKLNKETRILEVFAVKDTSFTEEEIKKIVELASNYDAKTFCYPEEEKDKKQWIIRINCLSTDDSIHLMDTLMNL